MRTRIAWEISNYCTAQCSYCPSKYWGGEPPRSISDFLRVTEKIINHYHSIGRHIDWTFNGGEPLEMFDFPAVLKLCKEGQGTIDITTNGGKMWLDWFAIEPNIDSLHLTYHYWQNPNLIRFIIQTFQNKNKPFEISVPIRHDYFDDDMNRANETSQTFGIEVKKTALYKMAENAAGLIDYTEDQLEQLLGKEWVDEHIRNKPRLTFGEHHAQLISVSPSYSGKLCNVGIERLNITAAGWVTGSYCNTAHLGNIWGDFKLPHEAQPCKMQACTNLDDQQITKFD